MEKIRTVRKLCVQKNSYSTKIVNEKNQSTKTQNSYSTNIIEEKIRTVRKNEDFSSSQHVFSRKFTKKFVQYEKSEILKFVQYEKPSSTEHKQCSTKIRTVRKS